MSIIFLANYLGAGEPPMQRQAIGNTPRARELQEAQQYIFDTTFLAKTSIACAVGAGLYAYSSCEMENQASLDGESRSLAPIIARVAAIKLLFVGCGGCVAYWKERLLAKEHTY
jgi:hypothetical protein